VEKESRQLQGVVAVVCWQVPFPVGAMLPHPTLSPKEMVKKIRELKVLSFGEDYFMRASPFR